MPGAQRQLRAADHARRRYPWIVDAGADDPPKPEWGIGTVGIVVRAIRWQNSKRAHEFAINVNPNSMVIQKQH
jgi:hypothetical protein